MKCALCNGKVQNKQGHLEFESKIAGKIIVPNVKYEECSRCNDKILSTSEYDKIADYIEEKENYLINQQPIGTFISAQEAAKILSLTKQAFSKNSRINRGFIISTKIDNRKYYLKKSVQKFSENRQDGRFLLEKYKEANEWHTICEEPDLFRVAKTLMHLFPKYSKFYRKKLTNIEQINTPTFKGIEETQNYFKQLGKKGKDKIYEAKFLIVGETGAGKTALMNKTNYQYIGVKNG